MYLHNKKLQLTTNFHINEFIKSSVAESNGIDNAVPSLLVYNNLKRLAEELEHVRAYINRPMVITSGYRCDALNAKVGGVPNSAHNQGLAADWHPVDRDLGWTFTELRRNAMAFNFDQLILEHKPNTSWIHYAIAETGTEPRREFFVIDMRKK